MHTRQWSSIIKQEKLARKNFHFSLESDKKNERGKTQVFTVIDLNLDQCLNFNEKIIVKLKHNNKNKFKTNNFVIENNIFENKNDSSGIRSDESSKKVKIKNFNCFYTNATLWRINYLFF